ncbi:MliC family protein [Sphingomonas parva]|uniref:MliC family protein n=1 Tax=Sphingomonas parva TaxID=2555898 RepID=UPI001430C529|nr:MliC family protein [Sphingomonas parva]
MKLAMILPAALMGACAAQPDVGRGPIATFACEAGRSFDVEYLDGSVLVTADGTTYRLDHGRSSIGRKYHSETVYFIADDDRGVLVGAPGGPYRSCREKAGPA